MILLLGEGLRQMEGDSLSKKLVHLGWKLGDSKLV